MATRRRKSRQKSFFILRFLSEPLQAFLARRIVDTVAAGFGLAGIFVIVSLLSYNRLDSSWNTASTDGSGISNLAGPPGAMIADLLLQGLGVAAYVFGLVLVAWSWRLFRRWPIKPFLLRLCALIFSAISLSTALAVVPSGEWLHHPYSGGSGGSLIMDRGAALLHPVLYGWEYFAIALFTGIVGISAFTYSLAIPVSGWKTALSYFWRSAGFIILRISSVIESFVEWVRRYSDPEWTPRKKNHSRTKPKISGSREPQESPPVQDPVIPQVQSDSKVDNKTDASSKTLSASQKNFRFSESGEWELPPADLLQDIPSDNPNYKPDESILRKNAGMLRNVLSDFNVRGEIVSIHPGPVVTLYELEPAPGIKTSRIISLSDDIARSMSAVSVRCAVVPGRNVIGIELPNRTRQTVYLRELLATKEFQKSHARLPLILGKNIGGQPIIGDLTKMPHLLVAGTTGSGKSVSVNTMILSLVYKLPPEKCRFIMIDPKMLELSVYDDIPHLLSPVVTEPGKAIISLKWTVQEMENRYRAMSKLGVRNIEGYNARLREARRKGEVLTRRIQTGFDAGTGKPVYEEQPLDLTELPYIVVVVDEFADLMLVASKDVDAAIQRLAQMARAAGIHLIMATQRPSVDVITGVIKANFPTRISFSVTSKVDSRTILGENGAEQLLGMGDMLYMESGGRITRVHGPFVSDNDVENVTTYLKAQGEPNYVEEVTEEENIEGGEVMSALFGESGGDKVDEFYDEAVAYIVREGKVSVSFIQRGFNIGYNRAAKIVEEMERQGVISKPSRTGKREILVSDYSDVGA
jgi:S-DNA-T family DNA segregation ATPase FtsK/SpoIIIE